MTRRWQGDARLARGAVRVQSRGSGGAKEVSKGRITSTSTGRAERRSLGAVPVKFRRGERSAAYAPNLNAHPPTRTPDFFKIHRPMAVKYLTKDLSGSSE